MPLRVCAVDKCKDVPCKDVSHNASVNLPAPTSHLSCRRRRRPRRHRARSSRPLTKDRRKRRRQISLRTPSCLPARRLCRYGQQTAHFLAACSSIAYCIILQPSTLDSAFTTWGHVGVSGSNSRCTTCGRHRMGTGIAPVRMTSSQKPEKVAACRQEPLCGCTSQRRRAPGGRAPGQLSWTFLMTAAPATWWRCWRPSRHAT